MCKHLNRAGIRKNLILDIRMYVRIFLMHETVYYEYAGGPPQAAQALVRGQ